MGGAQLGTERRPFETELLERERELGELDATIALSTLGSGQLLVFEGHAGIGKSRMIKAAGVRAEAAGLRVLKARGGVLEQEFAWGVALELFGPALAAATPASSRRLLGTDAPLAALFDASQAPPESLADAPLLAVVHGLFALASGLAERQPLLLLVDDAQWCDMPSLRLLLYLLDRLDALPIAVVLALRPGETGSAAELLERVCTHENTRLAPLGPLGVESVRALAHAFFPDAGAEFARACARRTGGNPFYLHELLLALRAEGKQSGEAEIEQIRSLSPGSISRGVLVRVGRLDPAAIALARAAAVLGDGAKTHQAAAVAGVDVDAACSAIDALCATEILAPGDPLRFVHPLVAEAIYADIAAAERGSAHLHAARILDGEGADRLRVAAHLLVGGCRGDSWVVQTLRAAAALARVRASPESAVRHLTRALAEPPAPEQIGQVLVELAEAQLTAGQLEQATCSCEEALSRLEDLHARAAAEHLLGRALTVQGNHLQAAAAFERGLVVLEDKSEDLARELQAAYVAAASLESSLRDSALAHIDVVLTRSAGELTPGERALLAQQAVQQAMAGTSAETVLEVAERAWGDGALLQAETADGMCWSLLTGALSFSEELKFSERICDAALADARRRGSPMAYATASYCRSYPRHGQCRITESLADVQAALGARDEGWETYLPSAQAMLACLQIERGELKAAEHTLAIAADENTHENTHENMGYPWVLDARGRLHVARAHPRQALEDFLTAGRLLVEKLSMPGPGIFPWRSGAALAAHATGRHDQALELAREDLALARKVGAPGMIGRALRTLGVIIGGSDGIDLLRQSTDSLARSQTRLEYARALVDFGAALRRAGHRSDARDPLRRGLEVAEKGGASVLRERARVELAAAGARPRKAFRSGRDALTPSELRVATMAADGLKNREIAQSLFVTTKAVEAHLHHSYQKLDVSSRAELPDALS